MEKVTIELQKDKAIKLYKYLYENKKTMNEYFNSCIDNVDYQIDPDRNKIIIDKMASLSSGKKTSIGVVKNKMRGLNATEEEILNGAKALNLTISESLHPSNNKIIRWITL